MGESDIVDRWCLKVPEQEHVCVEGASQTQNHVALRDTLAQNAALREGHTALELDLAAKGTNLVDYVNAKRAVMEETLKAAEVLSEEELAAIEEANQNGERFGAIKTERLVLREFVWADDEALFELDSNEENARYQTWPPKTKEQARREVETTIKNSLAVPRTDVELAVEYEGRFIGRVGANVKREGNAHADLWYSFLPEVQGKGYATEAMKAFIPLLRSPLELEIECDPRNVGSWRLAERLGFSRFELTERAYECKGEWVDSLVYRKHV